MTAASNWTWVPSVAMLIGRRRSRIRQAVTKLVALAVEWSSSNDALSSKAAQTWASVLVELRDKVGSRL